MDAAALGAAAGAPNPAAPVGGDQQPRTERLSAGVQQQLNLEGMRARAVGLYKAISRILEDFDAIARANPNASPKWQDVLGQFSMVSMELFNIVEDIKKVSKVFVVYPRNVNAENAAILPVMLSSKLLPEMEAEEATKRDNLLSGITNLTVSGQIEKLKTRIDMIGSACETAEKVIAESRKNYGLGARQGANLGPTLDKAQAAKIQEQEGLLRAAVNYGEGLRVPGDQRQMYSSLPSHLVDVLPFGDGAHNFGDNSGVYPKNTSTFVPNVVNAQGNPMQQVSGGQLLGRPAPSPGATGTPNFENVSTPPMPYANSPRSGTNMMNTPSPQQHLTAQQHRQKLMQTSQQQQLHTQQQLRPSAAGMLAQSAIPQLQDLQGQSQQKLQVPGQQQMQYNQALSQQYQNRQMQAGRMQPGMSQSQLNQGNQLRSHISQFTGAANSAMFTAAQASSNSQMMANIPGSMQSQSLLPQMQGLNQYSLTGGHPQRSHPSQMLTDQMFGMGGANSTSMMGMQQQQQFNMQANAQNLQQGMTGLQNQTQNPNFPQQRQQNQQ
ncbi:mediator of RNA polymerase II transcription subunit 8 isoform X1 [Oryza glaberrima]|uniref:mediator of RNA polymerase II transcription subunit 8 isoform X1 n=1 Tax=Oryza glaberrima TaxID=4538 RepID=UPI00224C303A|nr:mediator of RNA polymerase II transcription subunit 8 isoform X1 [Oryza glaberrima]XP_052146961.1 mediator of RNA polymerase II transcription subunit 8 isoform X1 [Oryza glaberrima]XP_052146962.1 mediator of RNA polymerase II transcription subunit 8 isoform X1 [Oryza glaberrima]XP_052146963.1 mediator of RNA polymerase II transcription subunit 8 isoform X1 [Oryza glaberrima]XP_052146964.1 mediator of RNA polymerase II transcription subunit 8 isoform X1 [Oryza glaberrima]XP_052146966.1 media